MRWLTAVFAILLSFRGLAIEEPFVLQAGATNIISLPEKSEQVWFGFERDRSIAAWTPMPPNAMATEYSVNLTPLEGGSFALPMPKSSCEFIAACRLKVNGRWRDIHPVLIDRSPITTNTDLKLGETFKGVLKESPARLVVHFVQPKLARNSEITENLEVVANRIGSPLDSVLRLIDNKRHENVNDDGRNSGRDSVLAEGFGERIDGVLEVSDVANANGPEYFYCLRTQYPPLIGDGPTCGLLIYDPMRPYFVARSQLIRQSEHEPNNRPISAEKVFLNGRKIFGSFDKPDDVDWYEFPAVANQRIILTAETREIGIDCDAGLAVFNEAGKLIAESVGTGAEGPSITNKVAVDGLLRLEVREIARREGSYSLRIEEAKPGVVLTTEIERVDFSKEGEAKIKVACKRYDYDGVVKLGVEGLPEGVSVTDEVIAKGKNEAELKLKRTKEVEAFQIRINGSIEQKETKEEFPVSTMPALRKLYPLQMFPCAAMDGWIAVNPPAP